MLLSINQPAYIPWIGYFHRIAISDRHVVLDHVQFEKNSFTNRNKIQSACSPFWLTVPVQTKGKFENLPISELEINNTTHWRRKHWRSISQAYARSPFFGDHKDFFASIYDREWLKLLPLCQEINNYLLAYLEVDTPCLLSSQLSLNSKKEQLVLDICGILKAKSYLSGPLGRNYINNRSFEKRSIQITYHDYVCPQYSQHGCAKFVANMSILDLVFNHGKRSRDLMMAAFRVSPN